MNFEFDNVYKIFLKRMNEIEKNLELVNYKGKFLIEIKKNKDTELKEVKEYIRLVEETYNSVMEYNALIISIYGCLENFIDDLLRLIDFKYNKILNTSTSPIKIGFTHFPSIDESIESYYTPIIVYPLISESNKSLMNKFNNINMALRISIY